MVLEATIDTTLRKIIAPYCTLNLRFVIETDSRLVINYPNP